MRNLHESESAVCCRYAGEDVPKTIIPSSYGYVSASDSQPEARYFFGHAGPSVWRPNQQVLNPLHDGIVQDWNAAEILVEHALQDGMRLEKLTENPLLVTEPAWNPKENRERMLELAFEGWDAPAYYSADRSVLSGCVSFHMLPSHFAKMYIRFASGKGTALIIDVGESSTSVIPVYDGFVVRKGELSYYGCNAS